MPNGRSRRRPPAATRSFCASFRPRASRYGRGPPVGVAAHGLRAEGSYNGGGRLASLVCAQRGPSGGALPLRATAGLAAGSRPAGAVDSLGAVKATESHDLRRSRSDRPPDEGGESLAAFDARSKEVGRSLGRAPYSPCASTYILNMAIRPELTFAETLGILVGASGPNGQYLVASTQPMPFSKVAFGWRSKMRLLGSPTCKPLHVSHFLLFTVAISTCLFELHVPGSRPNVVNTTRRPSRLHVTAQSATDEPANPGRTACLDDGVPNTRIARLSVGSRIDQGPIRVTAPRFCAEPPETWIV